MNRWALELGSDHVVREVDPVAACIRNGAPFTWIHLNGAEKETIGWLKENADIPDAVVSALTAIETRPRTEQIHDGALVNLRGLREEEDGHNDILVSIRMWAEKGRLISITFRKLGGLIPLREKMLKGLIHDPGDFVAALAMVITDLLDPEIATLGDVIDDCEVTLESAQLFEMRRNMAQVRSDAIGYRRFVVPQRQALERLALLEDEWLEEDDRLHLREASDRFARMAEELEAVRERAALVHEQLTDLRAEQIEMRTLVLSIVALVFLPLTFLTGLLGMNVDGIPFAHAAWAFWGVVGVCVALSMLIAGYFIRAHWFRG